MHTMRAKTQNMNPTAVECTAVASPGVDLEATRALAEKLGARFRARSWHAATD